MNNNGLLFAHNLMGKGQEALTRLACQQASLGNPMNEPSLPPWALARKQGHEPDQVRTLRNIWGAVTGLLTPFSL